MGFGYLIVCFTGWGTCHPVANVDAMPLCHCGEDVLLHEHFPASRIILCNHMHHMHHDCMPACHSDCATATWKGSPVAVKTMLLPAAMSNKERREKMAIMETAISSSLSHPNIVTTYTYEVKPLTAELARKVCLCMCVWVWEPIARHAQVALKERHVSLPGHLFVHRSSHDEHAQWHEVQHPSSACVNSDCPCSLAGGMSLYHHILST